MVAEAGDPGIPTTEGPVEAMTFRREGGSGRGGRPALGVFPAGADNFGPERAIDVVTDVEFASFWPEAVPQDLIRRASRRIKSQPRP
jgi:hypothetical protein